MEISRLMWAKKQPCWIKCQILWYYLLELKELKGNIDDNTSQKVEILSFFWRWHLGERKDTVTHHIHLHSPGNNKKQKNFMTTKK